MMNQAASATRRAPADSTTSAGCCPMLNAPFFGLPAPAAAPQCFMSSQARQLVQLAHQPQQQSNVVLPPQQQTVSQQPPTLAGQQQQLQTQPQQTATQRPHDQTSNYSTSLANSLHLLAGPGYSTSSGCMALAAALANLSHFQQQQQQQLLTQNHQATPINQQIQNVAPSTTTVNPVTQPNAAPLSNQVPILNYNSYPSAQPFINLPTMTPQPMQLPNHQHSQPPSSLPMPFYTSYPPEGTMEQAIALLANPQVANNIFNHIFMFLRSGLRSEPYHTHHHHQTHHFHHMHSGHHHHQIGQNAQANAQDASMPLDSLAINESKPRGLSRAEIDSLTPYIHTNEKDARTCVICLSKFELKSKIRPLPCNHAFHAKCVDKWLRTNRTCPICRRDALKTFNGKIKRI